MLIKISIKIPTQYYYPLYIDTILAGLGKYGYKMVQQFFTTTIGLPRGINTYNKWRKHKDKRATECLITAHYARQV